MSHPTNRSLPPELEFIIIDHLSADKPVPATCSLVCSRWLPHSRRHLFLVITVKPKPLNPNHLIDFLRVLNDSRGFNPMWAPIGPCITKITLDGRFWKPRGSTCSLGLLYAILSELPQLASLHLIALLLSDTTTREFTPDQRDSPRLNIDELVLVGCCKGGHDDPRRLLALLSRFSTIHSLTVGGWFLWRRHALPTFSFDAFSPPTVHSLTLRNNDLIVARMVYGFLAVSPSVTDNQLTHMSVFANEPENFGAFSDFARIHGRGLRKIKLRGGSWLPPTALHAASLDTCTSLHSLTLSMIREEAEGIRALLRAYTQFFHDHRGPFLRLASVRLEMQLTNKRVLDAFVRVSRDTYLEWPGVAMKGIPSEEAEENKQAWTSLEGALSSLPALECVEFVLYEGSDKFAKATKAELRSALESRLPRLWPSGIVKVVFDTYVYPYH